MIREGKFGPYEAICLISIAITSKVFFTSPSQLAKEADNTGYFPHATLYDFYNSIKSTYSQPISILGAINSFESFKKNGVKTEKPILEDIYHAGEIPRKGGNKYDILGCALFDGDRMVGELSGEETRFLLIARGDFRRGFFTIADPKVPELIIPFDVRQSRKPHVSVNFDKDKPSIDLKVKLEGNILAVQSRVNYENPELKQVVENAFEAHVKTGINKVLKKCKELNIDVFKFGEAAAMKFGTIKEWEEYNWLSRFSEADVKVSVDFRIRRTGTMIRSSEVVSTKGKE